MTIASLAVLASMNALLALSLKAKSIQSTPTFALTVVLALMYAPRVLSLQANNPFAKRQLNSTAVFRLGMRQFLLPKLQLLSYS